VVVASANAGYCIVAVFTRWQIGNCGKKVAGMNAFGLIDRYLARHVLVSTLAVWAVLVGFDVIGGFASELEDIGKGGYTISHAALYIFFTIPRRLYVIFPYVAVIGSLLGLGGLAARSELTAMRASGVSRLRIGLGALIALGFLTFLMMLNMESLAPASEQHSQSIANEGKSNKVIMARYSGMWARDGRIFMNARSGGEKVIGSALTIELQDVRLFEINDDGKLISLTTAKTALRQTKGWLLSAVERTDFKANEVTVKQLPQWFWASDLDRRTLESALLRDRFLSSKELLTNINYLQRNQLDAQKFISTYWERWFYPLNVLALCLATLPFAFSSLRSGGFGKRLFYGIVIGISFLLLQRLFVDLADVYKFDVRLALALPPLTLMVLSFFLFRRLR
jgi:lipopolysaccharide export system permease protein